MCNTLTGATKTLEHDQKSWIISRIKYRKFLLVPLVMFKLESIPLSDLLTIYQYYGKLYANSTTIKIL